MKKTAVFTISTDTYFKELAKLTHPSIKAYAEKIGAEFINISQPNNTFANQKWLKFEVFSLLNKYDRIIYFDTDLIIREDCPNLFEKVPEDKLGIAIESRYVSRASEMHSAMKFFEIPLEWKGHYYNSGVMVLSRRHRQYFKLPKDFNKFDNPTAYINLIIQKEKVKTVDLDWRFNRTSYMDEKVGMTRFDSYILHYKNAPKDQIFPILTSDIAQWQKDAPDFKYSRKVTVSVSAGMGDQLCAEPAIRFMMDKIYPDADITVVSHFKRLFSHIPVKVMDYEEFQGNSSDTLVLYSCPADEKSEHGLSHVLFHPTDFATMSMFKSAIPHHDKTIKLDVYTDDFIEIEDVIGVDEDIRDLIVVHAGKWWASKTFPVSWWQEVVNKLASQGHKLALIGKTIDEKQGYQPIECPEGCYDFRDITSLGGMIALISKAKITLTNDSSPVHIAGAFDNWLVCMPSAKHPDHILPYRNGTQYYKTKALYKKLTIDGLRTHYMLPETDTIDMVDGDILEYIPKVDTVVDTINEICEEINKSKNSKKSKVQEK